MQNKCTVWKETGLRIEQALLLILHARNRVGGELVHPRKSVPKLGHFCAH